jgi:methylenetetrahydrofolate reductase (NADPH)
MKKITEILKDKCTFSVELVPPRNGSDTDIFKKLQILKETGVDFISVTKGAGGSLRGGTIPISYFSQEKFGLNCIAHFTCREIVKERVENNLVDMNYFGIKNVLALRGDAPDMEKDYEWKDGYKYAHQLVRQISNMNKGRYLARNMDGDKEFVEGKKTDFCIGVAAHPEELSGHRVEYLKKKVEEGADFAITQMIFDVDIFKSFLKELKEKGIDLPVIAGVWPLESKFKLSMAEEKFNASIPSKIKDVLLPIEDKEEFRKKGIELTIELCKELIEAGAAGIHLFLFLNVELAKEVFEGLKNGPDRM